ncbi:MAG: hypothetical protein ACKOX6_00780 [Bdellovibrio sp.]
MSRNNKAFDPNAQYLTRAMEQVLKQLPQPRAAMYKRSLAGDETFRLNFRAADKDLPICSECGNNCGITERLSAPGLSTCCYAAIEQDMGAGDAPAF